MVTYILKGLAIAGASVLTLGAGILPASASTSSNTPVVNVPLQIISQHGKAVKSKTNATVTPDNTITGDCGTAYMSVGDAGSGNANIVLGANSTQGAIIWQNDSYVGTAPVGSISGSGYSAPFSADWSTSYNKYVGYGAVAVTGSITVTTDNGSVCQSYPLAASTFT